MWRLFGWGLPIVGDVATGKCKLLPNMCGMAKLGRAGKRGDSCAAPEGFFRDDLASLLEQLHDLVAQRASTGHTPASKEVLAAQALVELCKAKPENPVVWLAGQLKGTNPNA
jgi:hypothetical protein